MECFAEEQELKNQKTQFSFQVPLEKYLNRKELTIVF